MTTLHLQKFKKTSS